MKSNYHFVLLSIFSLHLAASVSLEQELAARSDWDTTPPDYKYLETSGGITLENPSDSRTIVSFHHTVGCPDSSAQISGRPESDCVRAIDSFHRNGKKFSDCGYHYMIGSTGKIYEARPTSYVGAHTVGLNKGNIGVAFLGCFDDGAAECLPNVAKLEDAMIFSAAKLVANLSNKYRITPSQDTVVARSEYDRKVKGSTMFPFSPGNRVVAALDRIIELANRYLANEEL